MVGNDGCQPSLSYTITARPHFDHKTSSIELQLEDEPSFFYITIPLSDKPDSSTYTSVERLETVEDNSQNMMCVLNDAFDLSKVCLPDSVKELFLAQFDRLSVTEQVTMKCCAVLGTHFSLSLLKAVLPHRTSAQVRNSRQFQVCHQRDSAAFPS